MAFDRLVIGTRFGDLLDDEVFVPGERVCFRALAGDDEIRSAGLENRIAAGRGDDIVFLRGGSVLAGDGDDTIHADLGSSLRVREGAGSDNYFLAANGHNVRIVADAADPTGNDGFALLGFTENRAVLSYAATSAGITVDMSRGAFGAEIGSDSFTGFDTLIAGSGNDTLIGASGGSRLRGGDGNDALLGKTGNDVLRGGAGDDAIEDQGGVADIDAGDGDDTVVVGATQGVIRLGEGDNALDLSGSGGTPTGPFVVVLAGFDNRIAASGGDETIILAGDGLASVDLGENGTVVTSTDIHSFSGSQGSGSVETVSFTDHADHTIILDGFNYLGIDRIVTRTGSDVLGGSSTGYNAFESGGGNDEIICRASRTEIAAGRGDDLVHGSDGDAVIDMGPGLDRVFCGAGAETVSFTALAGGGLAQSLLYLFGFTTGTDHVALEPGADQEAFLALAREVSISGIDGVEFRTLSNDMLFIAGLTAAGVTTDLFL